MINFFPDPIVGGKTVALCGFEDVLLEQIKSCKIDLMKLSSNIALEHGSRSAFR